MMEIMGHEYKLLLFGHVFYHTHLSKVSDPEAFVSNIVYNYIHANRD